MSQQVFSFASIEEAQQYMADAEAAANGNLHPLQIALRDQIDETAYWVRPTDEVGLIFGAAWSWREQVESAVAYVPVAPTADGLGPDDYDGTDQDYVEAYEEAVAEALYSIRSTADARTRGYLFGPAHSRPYPEGELGDTHVANAWPISKEAFEEARAAGWRAVQFGGVLAAVMSDEDQRIAGGTPTLIRELETLQGAVDERRASS